MRTRRLAVAVSAALAAAAVCTAKPARADRSDVELSFDVRDAWFRAMPRFDLSDPTELDSRTVGPGQLPSTGGQHFLSLAVDSAMVEDRRLQFPLLGVAVGGAVGSSPRVVTSVDGTMVEMKPWTAGTLTFLLPGLGLRFRERRWMFGVNARLVFTGVWMKVQFADGASMNDSAPAVSAWTIGARAHVEACRRLDPTTRLCLFVDPHLHEFGWFNGASGGLRWEIGS